MLSLVYLFYFLMISWLLSRKRVEFMYLWCLSADFKNFWSSFTSLGKPKFEFFSMSLVHFIIRLIAIMSTVYQMFYSEPIGQFLQKLWIIVLIELKMNCCFYFLYHYIYEDIFFLVSSRSFDSFC